MQTLEPPKFENITLYYREGRSGKVYKCQIEAAGECFYERFLAEHSITFCGVLVVSLEESVALKYTNRSKMVWNNARGTATYAMLPVVFQERPAHLDAKPTNEITDQMLLAQAARTFSFFL